MLHRLGETFDFRAERLERRLEFLRNQNRSRRPSNQPNKQQHLDANAAFAESAELESFGVQPTEYAPAQLRPLAGIDRDFFEALIENPELAATAVEAIDPDWFESNTARMLLSAYQDLDLAGRDLDCQTLLLLIENEQLKNVVVSIQERMSQRQGKLPETAEQRYAAIMARYRERAFAAENSKQIEKLESATLTNEDEMSVLKALIEQQRNHHGIEPKT